MWGRAVLCGGAPSQADSQLQEQLFKLYHNERDLENLTEELRAKQKDHERMVSGNRRESRVNVYTCTCTYGEHVQYMYCSHCTLL